MWRTIVIDRSGKFGCCSQVYDMSCPLNRDAVVTILLPLPDLSWHSAMSISTSQTTPLRQQRKSKRIKERELSNHIIAFEGPSELNWRSIEKDKQSHSWHEHALKAK